MVTLRGKPSARKTAKRCSPPRNCRSAIAPAIDVAPILRGACTLRDAGGEGAHQRPILEFRTSDAILNFVNGKDVARYARAGVITPDHAIRTKPWPLIVPAPQAGKLDDFKTRRAQGRAEIHRRLQGLFRAQQSARARRAPCTIPLPRVVLVPGLGLFGLGASAKDAAHRRRHRAKPRSRASPTPRRSGASRRFREADMFDCEYWPLELAKLGARKDLPLAGQVAVITGAGGAIGAATAQRLRRGRRGSGAARSRCRRGAGESQGDRRRGDRAAMRRDRRRLGARRLRSGGRRLRRRRYRGLECRRRLARQDRRGRRGDLARRASS